MFRKSRHKEDKFEVFGYCNRCFNYRYHIADHHSDVAGRDGRFADYQHHAISHGIVDDFVYQRAAAVFDIPFVIAHYDAF